MIALDTNLLVRLLLQDVAAQARAVDRLFARAQRDRTPLFIADVVLCELVWVLARREKRSRKEIAAAVEGILDAAGVVVMDAEIACRPLAACRARGGDFADYMIREQAWAAGASEVVTFDRAVKGDSGFRILG